MKKTIIKETIFKDHKIQFYKIEGNDEIYYDSIEKDGTVCGWADKKTGGYESIEDALHDAKFEILQEFGMND